MIQRNNIGGIIVIGQHCFNTLGQVRSFGELGFYPIVIWINHMSQTPEGSVYIKEFHSFDSFSEAIDFIIINYSCKGKKYFISTDSDGVIASLDEKYDILKNDFFFFNAGSQGRLSAYMPKIEQIKLAEKHGLNVPHTELLNTGNVPQKLKYPIFTKSPDCFGVSWKESALICRNEAELKEAYKKIPKGEILLQEYIEKDNEVAIEGISSEGGDVLFLPIQGEYIRLPEGKFGTYKRNEHYNLGEEMFMRIQAILKEIRYSGIFEIEFLKDKNGELYFLEINFRHTQYNHAFTVMGMNFCQIWMELCLGNKKILNEIYLTKDPSYVMNERRDIKEYLLTGKVGLMKWIKDLIKADCYYSFDKKDLRYSLYWVKNSILYRINTMFKHKLTCL